jgi:hypothetical protein
VRFLDAIEVCIQRFIFNVCGNQKTEEKRRKSATICDKIQDKSRCVARPETQKKNGAFRAPFNSYQS